MILKSDCKMFEEPTNPEWPDNVFVFDESMSSEQIKEKILPSEDARISYDKKNDGGSTGETSETYTSKNHFNTRHYALLFKPGTYEDCKFEVGYYVQMAGLGKSPMDVKFTGEQSGPFVEALNKDMPVTEGGSIANWNSGLCLDTFWRSAENFSAQNCQWAVSQAAPLRNVNIEKDLMIGDGAAYSSGGFIANGKIGGLTNYTANQQWFSRHIEFGAAGAAGGAWNTVFSGCTGNVPTPGRKQWQGQDTDHVVTIEPTPEVRVEKPFITVKTVDGEDFYELVVPSPSKDATGPKVDGIYDDVRPFSRVKVCKPILPTSKTPPPEWDTFNDPLKPGEVRNVLHLTEEKLAKIGEEYYVDHDDNEYNNLTSEDNDLTNDLQMALDEGKDLILCPGLFFLTKPLIVSRPNQVILGLGLSTLIAPQDGSPCIRVEPNVPGVRIAGLTLEGSLQNPDTEYNEGPKNVDGERSLIDVGSPDVKDAGDPSNPTLLSDIFTRVGGSNLERIGVETDVMVRIHSGNVKGDNLWLWRADHVRLQPAGYKGREEKEEYNEPILPLYYQVRKGECGVKNAIKVNGDDVKMYGLFCEHTTEHQMVWNGERGTVNFFQCELAYEVDESFGEAGWVGYYVNPEVKNHTGNGVGVYSNFTVSHVITPYGTSVPKGPEIKISSPFTVFLNNKGGITNVIKSGDEIHGDSVNVDNKVERAWYGYQS